MDSLIMLKIKDKRRQELKNTYEKLLGYFTTADSIIITGNHGNGLQVPGIFLEVLLSEFKKDGFLVEEQLTCFKVSIC